MGRARGRCWGVVTLTCAGGHVEEAVKYVWKCTRGDLVAGGAQPDLEIKGGALRLVAPKDPESGR